MSKDLFSKFPDNLAFDFDYPQSSIWSPLLPRPLPNSTTAVGLDLSRRLSYGETNEMGFLGNTKKMAARIKRKFTDTVFENISRCIRGRESLSSFLRRVWADGSLRLPQPQRHGLK
ncbi:hypothetical protein PHJA_000347000 [Phtheirospermum japonicum]|uniref:Uncharacterized protein n=1 Tax=Phtheirospermum japonicum TaxID=374723 RepID=A0A830B4M0_9LAMI|nr:hypothetical protein PHJA_000347000 [Phtheirospermum japonicum]